MAVTPNYGWPVPVATDYVKDGWEAISDLGNAIDTTVAGLGSGLKYITSATASSVTSLSVNNCFSSTYENYRVIFNQTAAQNTGYIYIRFRASGSDRTGNDYLNSTQGLTYINGSYNLTGQTTFGYLNTAFSGFGDRNHNMVDIIQPFDSTRHSFIVGNSHGYTTPGDPFTSTTGIYYGQTNQNDGFTIYTQSGTFSGTVRIYGYQNS